MTDERSSVPFDMPFCAKQIKLNPSLTIQMLQAITNGWQMRIIKCSLQCQQIQCQYSQYMKSKWVAILEVSRDLRNSCCFYRFSSICMQKGADGWGFCTHRTRFNLAHRPFSDPQVITALPPSCSPSGLLNEKMLWSVNEKALAGL